MINPPVWIILTTYKRKDTCLRTIKALQENLLYDNIGYFICDDASPESYIDDIKTEIKNTANIAVLNGMRQGVGYMMNTALKTIWGWGVDLTLHMEDDWELIKPIPLLPYVETLERNSNIGMIRFGYLSTNLVGYTVGKEYTGVDELYWRIEPNEETYRFTGHPSLRHRRFHDKQLGGSGLYDEALSPGMTELSMCGKVNKYTKHDILYPTDCGRWGFFAHIGDDHLGAIEPEVKR
jgi:hypothetical protein